MSRGKKVITSLALLGLSVFLCVSPATAALTVSAAAVAGSDDLAPGPVGSVAAELNLDGTSVTVSWTLSADDFTRQTAAGGDFTSGGVFVNTNDVAVYNVWRQPIGGDATLVGSPGWGNTSFVDDTVVTGETYTYLVRAADASGNESAAVESGQVNLGPPPNALIEVEGVEPSQSVTMTFDGQIDVNNDQEVEAFADDFISKLAATGNISPEQVRILRIYTGSIIVEFEIIGADAPAAVETINAELAADPNALNLENAGPLTSSASFNSGAVDMGNVGIGAQLVNTLDFTNNPDDPDAILIIAAEVSGAGFSIDATNLTLAAGETAPINVTFTADDVNNVNDVYTGELLVSTNDPNNRTTIISLTAEISQGLDLPVITVSGAFNFGQVAFNGDMNSRDLTLTISNGGDLDLTGTLAIEGDGAFTLSAADYTVAGGESAAITVTFAPMAAVSYSGTIVITSNDDTQPETRVDLAGVGFDANLITICVDPVTGEIIHGDLDGNLTVNFDDFFIFADNFGATGENDADFDGNLTVNFDDFFIFADNFGKDCILRGPTNFSATIDATQAGTTSTGSGSATVTLSADETTVTYSATVTGLADLTAAHFHNAPAGSTGGVAHTLTFVDDGNGTWNATGSWSTSNAEETLTAALVEELKAGNLYINVHTTAVPAGEIRGQVLAQ